MKRTTNLVTFGGNPVTLMGKIAKPKMYAKNFYCIGQDLKHVKLSDYQGKVRIITSAPSIDTGLCAEQTRKFNEAASKLEGVQIISISNDLPFALKRFCEGEGINNLVAVSDHKDVDFGIKYGLLIEEFRLLARAVVIIDKEDKVRYVEIAKEVGEHLNYEKAIAAAKELV